ncbi:hypothetical protein GM3708_2192 [Geminocystis sp. NIES-3708]|uniref:hypothetical protein n=1 Tax=Geminocystis sp. NIES-3708 TaxID=1615909 RepID=UPI0005FCBDAF|nr:hypothetical protein [Geminocystis sp. NIES-3708]BAQ61786.1 hypothetical protein GM3708_2192 [Geminocystis sp. NIES-3708]
MIKKTELQLEYSAIESAINRAIDFFWSNQLPDGEFKVHITQESDSEKTSFFDSCTFGTALILYNLSFRENFKIEGIREKALNFLNTNMDQPGLWRYFSTKTKFRHTCPPDVDDTCCVAFIFKKYKITLNNKDLILANRNQNGLFYTWIIPRFSMLFTHPQFWLNSLLSIPSYSTFWRFSECRPNDLDCGINANVVLYLGEIEETKKVIDYLIDVTLKGKETEFDKWYLSSFPHYYFLSRAYFNGVKRLGVLKETIVSNLEQKFEQEGYNNPLDTALAACTFLNFGLITPTLQETIAFLLANQKNDGSWVSSPFYFIGPTRTKSFGSLELTTGVCVEALIRYQQAICSSNISQT